MAHVDGSAHDGGISLVAGHVHNERTINLDFVHWQFADVGQRGVAGTKVIYRQANLCRLQGSKHAQALDWVQHGRGFGDFEHQPLGGDPVDFSQLADIFATLRITQVGSRNIDGYRGIAVSRIERLAELECLTDDPTGQWFYQPGALGHGDEFIRRHKPDRKSTRLNSSHVRISYAVFCLKK